MEIVFYTTQSGRCPVREYLSALEKEERASVGVLLNRIKHYGFNVAGVQFRQIERKLWEMKMGSHRIFYLYSPFQQMVLLHAYKKQGNKLPKREREIAWKRMKEYLP